jgi:soluble lytic murein transglycosylase
MSDRDLLAAATLACELQVWDRCINTSDRAREAIDFDLLFPMPHKEAVLQRSREIGLDPAYVYGLIRQESRFVMDARSGVGASGLMQVMPATARWTARKIGMTNFTPEQITQRDVNIAIGTGYLKLVLDNFEGSMPLAAAAYNAGPSRSRKWRQGPTLEGAVWAENVPFHETRDYVKKVLSNATNYAAVITGEPQSLKARLGTVGPRDAAAVADNTELP